MAEGVEVTVHLKIDRQAWEAEYSVDTEDPNYDFDIAVKDWFAAEVATINGQGEWPSIERIF